MALQESSEKANSLPLHSRKKIGVFYNWTEARTEEKEHFAPLVLLCFMFFVFFFLKTGSFSLRDRKSMKFEAS